MNNLFESLESRRLLSAAPVATDQAALNALLKAEKAEIAKCGQVAVADARTLVSDVRKTHNSGNVALANMLRRDTLSSAGLLAADLRKVASSGIAAGQRLVADVLRLVKDPLNATLISRVGGDAAAVFSLSNNNAFGNDPNSVENTITADLNQIASANASDPKLKADMAAEQSAVQRCAAMAESDGNALTNSLGALFNDIRSLVPLGTV